MLDPRKMGRKDIALYEEYSRSAKATIDLAGDIDLALGIKKSQNPAFENMISPPDYVYALQKLGIGFKVPKSILFAYCLGKSISLYSEAAEYYKKNGLAGKLEELGEFKRYSLSKHPELNLDRLWN